MKYIVALSLILTAAISLAVEPISIQNLLRNLPKETSPSGSTRVPVVTGGILRQMSYSSISGGHSVTTSTASTLPNGSIIGSSGTNIKAASSAEILAVINQSTRAGYGITDAASSAQGAKADSALQPTGSGASLTGVLKPADVFNNLTSTSTTAPLAAAQGPVIQGLLDGKVAKNELVFNVRNSEYGAIGDGVADDYAAIQAAINAAASAGGGTVFFPPGQYKITSTLIIGNGSATSWSTYNGVKLVGAGVGFAPDLAPYPVPARPVEINSRVVGPAIQIDGPIAGWGVENIYFTFGGAGDLSLYRAIHVISGQHGVVRNVSTYNCPGTAVTTTTRGSYTGGGSPLTAHNEWIDVSVSLWDGHPLAKGIVLDGSTGSGNTCFDRWHGFTCNPGTAGGAPDHTCITLRDSDNNYFYTTHLMGFSGTGDKGIVFDQTGSGFARDNMFFGLEVGNMSVTQLGTNDDTPNRIFGFSQTNLAEIPNLPKVLISNANAATATALGQVSVGSGLAVDADGVLSVANGIAETDTPTFAGLSLVDSVINGVSMRHTSSTFASTLSAGSSGNPSLIANWVAAGSQYDATKPSWNISLQVNNDKMVFQRSPAGSTIFVPYMTIKSGGDVGIGAAAPAYSLDVNQASFTKPQLHITTADSDSGTYLFTSGAGATFLTNNATFDGTNFTAKGTSAAGIGMSAGAITFRTNLSLTDGSTFTPAINMKLDSNGSLLLGTTTNDGVNRLQVNGGAAFSGAVTASNLNLDSGTYNPTVTGQTNLSNTTTGKAMWTRNGSYVTTSGTLTVDPTAAGACSLYFSLPATATTTFSDPDQASGVAFSRNIAGQGAALYAYTGASVINMAWTAVDTTSQLMNYVVTYEVQ